MFDSLESRRDQSMSRKSALTIYAVYFMLDLFGVFVALRRHSMLVIVPLVIAAVLAGVWFVLTKADAEGDPQRKHNWRVALVLALTLIPTFLNSLRR